MVGLPILYISINNDIQHIPTVVSNDKKSMKQTILLLFIIFSSLKVEAKKMNFPLEIITGSADLIVIGEIDIVKIIHIHLELVKP